MLTEITSFMYPPLTQASTYNNKNKLIHNYSHKMICDVITCRKYVSVIIPHCFKFGIIKLLGILICSTRVFEVCFSTPSIDTLTIFNALHFILLLGNRALNFITYIIEHNILKINNNYLLPYLIYYEKFITLSSIIRIESTSTLLLLSSSTVTGIDCPGTKPV